MDNRYLTNSELIALEKREKMKKIIDLKLLLFGKRGELKEILYNLHHEFINPNIVKIRSSKTIKQDHLEGLLIESKLAKNSDETKEILLNMANGNPLVYNNYSTGPRTFPTSWNEFLRIEKVKNLQSGNEAYRISDCISK